MKREFCEDCRWLRMHVDRDNPAKYWCIVKRHPIAGAIVWRRACSEFQPQLYDD